MDNYRPSSVFSVSSRPTKHVLSASLFYSTFTVGICLTILNSSILEFTNKFQVSLELISKVFIISLFSYLISAFLFGILLNFVNRQKCIIFCLTLMAIGLFLLPGSTQVSTFFLCSSLIGLGGGGYDTAQMAWMIDIWRHDSAPYILSQNFAYSLGTLVPPILLAPCLAGEDNVLEHVHGSKLYLPFSIAGCLVGVSVLIQVGIYFRFNSQQLFREKNGLGYAKDLNVNNNEDTDESLLKEEDGGASYESSSSSSSSSSGSRRRQIYLIGLAGSALGFYLGLENCTSQFLPTFCHFSEVHLSEAEGVRVLFRLQLGYAIGRFLGIFVVLKMPPQLLLYGNLVLLLISNTILLALGPSSVMWLSVGSALTGLGMSTVYPALYAYTQKIVSVTDSVVAAINVTCVLISSIFPLIVGSSMERNPAILIYVNFFSIGTTALAFSALIWATQPRVTSNYLRF